MHFYIGSVFFLQHCYFKNLIESLTNSMKTLVFLLQPLLSPPPPKKKKKARQNAKDRLGRGSVSNNHSQEQYLSFVPRLCKFESNTTSD